MKKSNTDRLVLGLKSILKNRSSLLEGEVKIIEECIELLEGLESDKLEGIPINIEYVAKMAEILIRYIFLNDYNDF